MKIFTTSVHEANHFGGAKFLPNLKLLVITSKVIEANRDVRRTNIATQLDMMAHYFEDQGVYFVSHSDN